VWGGEFCQVSIFTKLVCQIVGGQFFFILPKLDGCQVGLANSWSCSEIQYNTDTNGTLLLYNKLIGPYIDSTHGTCPFLYNRNRERSLLIFTIRETLVKNIYWMTHNIDMCLVAQITF
jgi:hypothetical protein